MECGNVFSPHLVLKSKHGSVVMDACERFSLSDKVKPDLKRDVEITIQSPVD